MLKPIRKSLLTVGGVLFMALVVVITRTYFYGETVPGSTLATNIDIEKRNAAERLAGALAIKTISIAGAPVAADAFLQLHEYLERTFPVTHNTLTRETVNGYSLLYTWEGINPDLKPILLLAHMDVVPVEKQTYSQWSYPPFAGAVADGYIWGRGALDMKHSLMAIMESVEYLLEAGVTPSRTVYLAFGHDEEIGGHQGAAKIAEMLNARGVNLEFTLDEGSPIVQDMLPGITKPAALIGLAQKGYVTLELTATGPGGHGSMPPQNSAIGNLAGALHRLNTQQMPAGIRSPVTEMFAALAPEMSLPLRMVMANQWLFGPLVIDALEASPATNAAIRTTTAITVFGSGDTYNVLPTVASAVATFRILPGDTVAMVIEHVNKVVNDPGIKVEQTGAGAEEASPVSSIDSFAFDTIRKTIYQTIPNVIVAPSLTVTGTDSGHYQSFSENSYRFVPVRIGPDNVKRIHGIDERVGVDNYAEIIRFYIQLLRNINLKNQEEMLGT
jgi:carboxypeptidase PM20D1